MNTSQNNQPLLFAQGGWLDKKNRPKHIANKWGIVNKYAKSCLLLCVQYFKFD